VGETYPTSWQMAPGIGHRLIVTLPLPPNCLRPNGSHGHWAVVSKARKKYRCDAGLAAKCSIFKANRRWSPLAGAMVGVRWFSKAKIAHRDGDNALAALKSGFDGLADAGVVLNDSGITYLPVCFETDPINPRVDLYVFCHGPDRP